jgi:hypothetical protein
MPNTAQILTPSNPPDPAPVSPQFVVLVQVTQDPPHHTDPQNIYCNVRWTKSDGSTLPLVEADYDQTQSHPGQDIYSVRYGTTFPDGTLGTLAAQVVDGANLSAWSADVHVVVRTGSHPRDKDKVKDKAMGDPKMMSRFGPFYGGGGQLTINSPQPGGIVQTTFTASGTITNAVSYNVSGCIIDTSNNVYNGTTTANGDANGDPWSIEFTAPSGSLLNCVLKVWCTDDNTVFAQESLGGASGGSGHHGGGGSANVKPPPGP